MGKSEIAAFAAGVALGQDPDCPLVKLLMSVYDISDDEMDAATDHALNMLRELGLLKKTGKEIH